jgi:RNA polymerase sigma-70 factor, ECF subfamily
MDARRSGGGALRQHEQDLVQRLQRGDEAAFAQLVDQFGEDLYALAASMLRDRTAAADALQETLLGAYRGIARFRGDASLKTWLTGILVRQVYKSTRRKRPTTAIEDWETVPSPGSTEDGVAARLDVQVMLDALSPEHRDVLVLRELQGLSYDEIAAALELPRGTVESRLFRARKRLQELFGEERTRQG